AETFHPARALFLQQHERLVAGIFLWCFVIPGACACHFKFCFQVQGLCLSWFMVAFHVANPGKLAWLLRTVFRALYRITGSSADVQRVCVNHIWFVVYPILSGYPSTHSHGAQDHDSFYCVGFDGSTLRMVADSIVERISGGGDIFASFVFHV